MNGMDGMRAMYACRGLIDLPMGVLQGLYTIPLDIHQQHEGITIDATTSRMSML